MPMIFTWIVCILQVRVVFVFHLCPAVRSCRCDCKLIINTQLNFFRGSNFDPDVFFFPLTYQKKRTGMLFRANVLRSLGHVKCVCTVMVNFRSPLQAGIACQGEMQGI